MLARRILGRQRGGDRQIVVITDGEPTAHFENGQVEFSYPPTRRTIQETLREVQRCTREGITINTFMLERSRALAEFVALVTRLNRGRAFYATPGAPRRVRPRRLRVEPDPRGGLTAEALPNRVTAPELPGYPRAGVPGPSRSGVARSGQTRRSLVVSAPRPVPVPPRHGRDRRVRPDVRLPDHREPGPEEPPERRTSRPALSDLIERRIVIPGAIVQGITGVALIAILGVNPLDRRRLPLAASRGSCST